MDVLVAYESDRGRARHAAEALAHAAASHGVPTLTLPIDEVEPTHLAGVDAIIAGCWMPGKVPFGDMPTRRLGRWIDQLPPCEGRPAAVFCTYRFLPHTFADTATRTAETLSELSTRFELRGARIATTRAIWTRFVDKGAAILVDDLLERVLPT
jgi:flavodoxin